jgi:amidase
MELHYESLLGVSGRIRDGEISAQDVTAQILERIERYDGMLHSALMILADSAMAEARAADAEIAAGNWRGPLHGVPVGIKDLLWTKGLPTTAGMDILRDFRPAEDATVVERLRAAGAVIVAKLHMTEGAGVQHHPSFPRPVNPWSPEHWTGVSSSGSGVATAAGLCFASIGSDTGGSIRMPSSANNLTGIKPTWGRVSRHGLIHLAEHLDHLGPMARSAGDAAAVLLAIAGADPRDPTCLADPVPDYLAEIDRGVEGMTLGIDRKFATEGVPDEVVSALDEALAVFERLGMKVKEVQFPWAEDEMQANLALFSAGVALAHAEHYPAKADRYGSWLGGFLALAGQATGTGVVSGYLARDRFKGRLRDMFTKVDMLLLPGLGRVLPTWREWEPIEKGEAPYDFTLFRFTSPFDISGTPTISLPGGFTEGGLPIGIQLAGPALSEPALIRAGAAFQRETDFHQRHPDLEALQA